MDISVFENNYNKKCPYCNEAMPQEIFNDHLMCHELEREENRNRANNLNQRNDNYNINNNNSSRNNNNFNNQNEEENNNILSNLLNNFISPLHQRQNECRNDNGNILNSLLVGCLGLNDAQRQYQNNHNHINNNNQEIRENNILNGLNNISNIVNSIGRIKNELVNMGNSTIVNSSLNLSNNQNNQNNINNNHNSSNIINRYEQRNKNDNNNINKIMEYLPSSIVKEKNAHSENKNCIICLGEFEQGETITTLPCVHIFHTNCIKSWLKSNSFCPVCKYKITLSSILNQN